MNIEHDFDTISKTAASYKAERRAGQYTEACDPPALQLDERGMIQDCNKTFEKLFGFRRSSLVWRHVSSLFPQLVEIELVRSGQINQFLNYLCRCGHTFQMQGCDGKIIMSSLNIFRIESKGRNSLRMIVRPAEIDNQAKLRAC